MELQTVTSENVFHVGKKKTIVCALFHRKSDDTNDQ